MTSARTSRRPTRTIAALVVTAALLAGCAPTQNDATATTPDTPSAARTPTDPSPTTSDSVCGLPAGDQAAPATALGPATVRVGDGLAVPSVQGVGPGITGGVSRCFAHSPTGAVVAAANFIVWLSSNQQLDEVTTTLIAAGADRDRMLAEVHSSWDGSTTVPLAVLGYGIEVRSADEALVTIAASLPSDAPRTVTAWPLVMIWQDGDWKVKPPSNDRWGQEIIRSLPDAGLIPWAA